MQPQVPYDIIVAGGVEGQREQPRLHYWPSMDIIFSGKEKLMKLEKLLILMLVMGLNACASKATKKTAAVQQYTGTGTLVIKEITFAKGAYIRDAVRNECHLPDKLAHFVEQYSADQYAGTITDASVAPADAQILSIEIESATGGGGGAWSGGKAVMINVKLTQNGKQLGDFKGRRFSGGGAFATFKGTCSILGRCVKALGRDVSEWLQHPAKGSVLGDM